MKTSPLYNLALLFFCLTLTGCGVVKIDWANSDHKSSDFVEQVAEDLEDASKADCEYAYNYFEGSAIYVEKAGKNMDTAEWQALVPKVHEQLGWDMEEYSDLTETVQKELKEAGFEDPKSLSDVDTREKLAKILREAAQGALKAKNSK